MFPRCRKCGSRKWEVIVLDKKIVISQCLVCSRVVPGEMRDEDVDPVWTV